MNDKPRFWLQYCDMDEVSKVHDIERIVNDDGKKWGDKGFFEMATLVDEKSGGIVGYLHVEIAEFICNRLNYYEDKTSNK